MDRKLRFRQPSLADSYRVAALIDKGLQGADVLYDRMTRTSWRRRYTRHLYLPLYFHFFNEGWLLEKGEETVGWLHLLYWPRSLLINNIGVPCLHRRQGHGRHLIEWAVHRARKRGKELITLAVTARNRAAVELYQQSGFRTIHHGCWRGVKELLPPGPSSLQARRLSVAQRRTLFYDSLAGSLAADGHPAAPLLADYGSQWYIPGLPAWELWQGERPIGYAEQREAQWYLRLDDPGHAGQLQSALSLLAAHLDGGPLLLDLGSDHADRVAGDHLLAAGWELSGSERVMMVRETG